MVKRYFSTGGGQLGNLGLQEFKSARSSGYDTLEWLRSSESSGMVACVAAWCVNTAGTVAVVVIRELDIEYLERGLEYHRVHESKEFVEGRGGGWGWRTWERGVEVLGRMGLEYIIEGARNIWNEVLGR